MLVCRGLPEIANKYFAKLFVTNTSLSSYIRVGRSVESGTSTSDTCGSQCRASKKEKKSPHFQVLFVSAPRSFLRRSCSASLHSSRSSSGPRRMAALSARLANMGFMKRAAAAKGGQQGGLGQEVVQPAGAPPPSQQHRTRQAAVKQEPRTHAVKAEAGDHKPRQQSASPHSWQHQPAQQQQQQRSEGTFKLSENITNMKFMQRAQLKRSREDAFDKEQAAKDAAEWVAPKAIQDRGCLILHERDPLPAGVSGRMSFGFGHMHDLAKAEEAEREAAATAAASEAQIKDEEMGGYGFGSGKGWSPSMMRTKDSAKRANKRQKIKKEHQ